MEKLEGDAVALAPNDDFALAGGPSLPSFGTAGVADDGLGEDGAISVIRPSDSVVESSNKLSIPPNESAPASALVSFSSPLSCSPTPPFAPNENEGFAETALSLAGLLVEADCPKMGPPEAANVPPDPNTEPDAAAADGALDPNDNGFDAKDPNAEAGTGCVAEPVAPLPPKAVPLLEPKLEG